MKTNLDFVVKENNNLKIELENEKNKEESKARIIYNLQKEWGNEKKKEESSANTIHNLKKQLENMKKKKEVNYKNNP